MAQSCNNKQELRKWAKEVRSKLDMDALSKILAEKLKQTEEYKNAKNVMIFYPLKDETNLLSLTKDKTKSFYLPKIDGDNLLCCKFDENTELCKSCFHTMEPNTKAETQPVLDIVIVPALAVDKKNYRLGYGKGFYDRFLGVNKIKSIVCIPKELITDTVFRNEFDIPVDIVITQD